MSGMITNYDFTAGPYPARVRIAIAEKNLTPRFKWVFIDLFKGQHKLPEHIAKNYSGTVPVLEFEDGTFLSECTAITEYLDALDGEPTLTGRTAREKGHIHMMSKRCELEVLDAFSTYFHHATPGLGPEVELYQNHEWGLRALDKSIKGLHYFDSILQKQPFVAGDEFTMADCTLIGGIVFYEFLKVPVPAECVALLAWWAKVQERPSVKNRITMSEPAASA